MRILIQRVEKAEVSTNGHPVCRIGKGILILVGVGTEDCPADAQFLARKVSRLRIFPDSAGKMNLNIQRAGGEIISVPQFTLYAELCRGNRPGFDRAALPEKAEGLWQEFNLRLREQGLEVKTGVFGADMAVELINSGPVTIWLDSETLKT